jgi:hypothetical protein
MSLIDKAYFTLEEIEERWQLPHRDVVYLAENGLLRLSVRLFDMRLEWGEFDDLGNGDWNRIPTDQRWFSGLQDLREHDAFRLFRDGEVAIDQFAMPEGSQYCHLREPTDTLTIRVCDVVVQRPERDRVEKAHGLAGAAKPTVTSIFRQVNDYGEVHVAGRVFNLGHVQSRVVKQLHRAAITGDPWCSGKVLLAGAGSSSTRVADLFKSQRDWRQLIESDRRGNYRLRLLFSDPPPETEARCGVGSSASLSDPPADPPARAA